MSKIPPSGHAEFGAPVESRAEVTTRLFQAIADSTSQTERDRLREEVVMLNMPVAESIASRYRDRGLEQDDLAQVAYMGLVKAARGFDPSMGKDFLQYAVPTVAGEVKRHFRDAGWMIRPPRRIQEMQANVSRAANDLGQSLGRSPRPSEIAEVLDQPVEEVIEALTAFGCFRVQPLDLPVGEDGALTLADSIGGDDPELDRAEARILLGPAMRNLSDRDRRILALRFGLGWTQEKIATDIGVTQMQVSRLLSRILADLRRQIAA